MKSPRAATLVATAITLILGSVRVTAGELPFNAPATEQATQSAPLLHQAARALHDMPYPGSGGEQISNLWLFPTADATTIFARYNLGESSTEHLVVLTMDASRIVESRELTSSAAEPASHEAPNLHWSALIGTGDAAHVGSTYPKLTSGSETNSAVTASSHDVPPSLHWSAIIGTGAAATTSPTAVHDTKQRPSPGAHPVVAAAHWTSQIGTGHALDSTGPVM